MSAESMDELEDPESMRYLRIVLGKRSDVRKTVRETGFKSVEVLSVTWFTRGCPMHSSCHRES